MVLPTSPWGSEDTQLFYQLGIDDVLAAVEIDQLRCTGRCLQLNSMENRVYEIEIELDEARDSSLPKNHAERFRIAKFYRPGRWSQDQIQEEHDFLSDLQEAEIPVIAPVPFSDGSTIKKLPNADIYYTLFPKQGGRSPDEFTVDQLEQMGRLLARAHNVGAQRVAKHRMRLDPATYGLSNLEYLLRHQQLPSDIAAAYQRTVEEFCTHIQPWFDQTPHQRIHGDCHLGNILWGNQGAFLIDFDDMVSGPAVQDFWMLLPGRDQAALHEFAPFLEGYESMRPFDRRQLHMIEMLRGLRYIHYATWIAKRWGDPAFKRTFPQFGESKYWHLQLSDLQEQLMLVRQADFV